MAFLWLLDKDAIPTCNDHAQSFGERTIQFMVMIGLGAVAIALWALIVYIVKWVIMAVR